MHELLTTYGLDREVLARMVGLSRTALARWEKDEPLSDLKERTQIDRVANILERAAGVMRREYIPTWLHKPSPACTEIGATAPIDLMERGDYDTVEEMLFLLGSGVPY